MQPFPRPGVLVGMPRDPKDDALALEALAQFQSAEPDAAIMVAMVVDDAIVDSQTVAMRLSQHAPLHLIAAAEALIRQAIEELEASTARRSEALPRLRCALVALQNSGWPLQPRCARSPRKQSRPMGR